jgi:hypothetical protein
VIVENRDSPARVGLRPLTRHGENTSQTGCQSLVSENQWLSQPESTSPAQQPGRLGETAAFQGSAPAFTYGRKLDDTQDERGLRAHLADLLRSAAKAVGSVRRGVGTGSFVEFRLSRSKGSALVAQSQLVHVAIV